MTRLCTKCNTQKEFSEFYSRPEGRLKLSSHCKRCVNAGCRDYYDRNRESIKVRARRGGRLARQANPERARKMQNERRHRFAARPENATYFQDYARAYRKAKPQKEKQSKRKHVNKHLARQMVHMAVRLGMLIRPDRCERCGIGVKKAQGHHPDYSKPLEVEWLCSACHRIRDNDRRAIEKKAALDPCIL